ncbi:glycosyltransferase family 1 protein [Pedobacter frigidisoli]|uniref:Glycosyltransferase family 1 protein n=1 Tax=Pedobacter frigidisoli TaxID=2530455 RepID=A0A4R0NMA0_9SPHI|nr:glycosyltransferase family 4 protein [Pedobacter frigidisoli]TCD01980.1 glycosyltransferase family 1 protein [Pedobacter frigidisoli]
MKKVVIIGPSISRTKGGMASVLKGFMDRADDFRGFELTLLTSHVEGSAGEKLQFFFKCLIKLMFTKSVSLVHVHTACDASFYRKAIFTFVCKLRKIPVFIHIHGADFDSFYLNSNKFIQGIISKTLKSATRVIVLSKYWQDFFYENMKLENVVVLFNAVNCELFNTCVTVPKNISSFLFLGRLGERKGTYDLINAIDKLSKDIECENLSFVFAGDGEIDKVKEIISDKNLGKYIDVLGWIDEKMKLEALSKSDTVVLPSYNEGLPVALLEAMAAGKVVLSTPVGGIPDLVYEDVNGFLIKPGDVDALASRIKYIAHNPDQMRIISEKNMLKIKENFDAVAINGQLLELYNLEAR